MMIMTLVGGFSIWSVNTDLYAESSLHIKSSTESLAALVELQEYYPFGVIVMKFIKHGDLGALLIAVSVLPSASFACGGFFCQLVPINQAAEQIVFRQDGNQTTAMIQIQFAGDSEDFSWVVPVPSTPEYEVGSNTLFTDLERVTRPQFNLTREGQECAIEDFPIAVSSPVAESVADGAADSRVIVESVQDVGGYVVTLISGDNAESISQWLIDNGYDLTDKGEELLAPYVEEGMKFVAVKLQQNRGTGSIQPLIMKYQSDKPEVPIRLTAVAALEDMGVLVWLLGDSRAVPENYLHVTPNYTRLDWFSGTRNAYGSYQSLITDAMNEAGGQGFATDYAGRFDNLTDSLTTPADLEAQLDRINGSSDVEFISLVQNFFPNPIVTETLTHSLPLQNGQFAVSYFDRNFLITNFTTAELMAARNALATVIRDEVIAPLQLSIDVLGGNPYMTRLYTTLSADEMTLDPSFVFNTDMDGQQLDRNATLNVSCIDDSNHWTLKLGEGTGRRDEVVIDTIGPIPFTTPAIQQDASWRIEETAEFGLPTVQLQREFQVASLGSPGLGITTDTGETMTGSGTTGTGSSGVVDSGSGGDASEPAISTGGGAFGLSLLLLFSAVRRRAPL